ncbi:MAG: hypothetical protein LAN59_02990 [Acidobacteriia bacterium]|nr:hypothetical protein [Terriglobia bacterium]
MNLKKLCTTALASAAMLLCASVSHAQAPQIVAVGSSGVFSNITIAMLAGDPITGTSTTCGTKLWTAGAAIAQGIDARNGSIPAEGGTIAVVWDNDTTPTTVCAYLSVDSVVGQRLFFGQAATGDATLNLTSAALTTAGANKVAFVTDTATTGLPSAVYSLLNGQHFNIAFTDIRPEDGQMAYGRAACNRSSVTDETCFGYGPLGGIGTSILSSYSQTSSQVVAFSISGTDPFTGLPIPGYKTINVGADPIVIFYNKTDTAAGGLGALLPTNINHTTVTSLWSGLIGVNDQLVGYQTGSPKALHVVAREPMSGTYNTFEWQMVHTRDSHGGDYGQEYNFGPTPAQCFTPPSTATYVPPTVSCANPMNVTGSGGATYGGFRTRAIGTGEEVNAVNSANNPNSLGYAFWGLGTFGGKSNIKYMTLDGVDPIYPSYSTNGGSFPNCTGAINLGTFSCTGPLPTFDNVKNGNYRNWSMIRAAVYNSYTPPTSGPSVTTLIQATQDQSHVNIPDFVPAIYCANAACTSTVDGMPAFRSHYPVSGKSANNGTASGFCASDQTAPNCVEEGGDVAGVAFLDIQDQDYFNLTGNEFLTWIQ